MAEKLRCAHGRTQRQACAKCNAREAERRKPLPEHGPVPHDPGYWMTETCERCRRQSLGQRELLAALLPERQFNAFYDRQKADRG